MQPDERTSYVRAPGISGDVLVPRPWQAAALGAADHVAICIMSPLTAGHLVGDLDPSQTEMQSSIIDANGLELASPFRSIGFVDKDEGGALHDGGAGAHKGDLDIFDLAFLSPT
jgi:hypothetical protein